MIKLLLALQIQSVWTVAPQTVTVGDTVRISRRVVSDVDVQARIEPLADDAVIVQLSDPRAAFAEGTLGIQYTVAAFAPGTLAVAMPDAELLFPDGRTELVPGDTAWIVVESVLTDSASAPRAVVGPIDRSERRVWPLVTLLFGAVGSTVVWGMLRRRQGRPDRIEDDVGDEMPNPPVDRWIAAGEGRSATTYVTHRLREALAELVPAATHQLDTEAVLDVLARERPDLPVGEIESVLRELDRARFAPAVIDEFVDVIDRAERVYRDLYEAPGADPA
ncbi:MAG: hypothetical protein V3T56_10050 [Gemmatimonadales bacterium]